MILMVEELLGNIKGPTGPTGATGPAGNANLFVSFIRYTHSFIQLIDFYADIPKLFDVCGFLKGVREYEIRDITEGSVNGYIGDPANNGRFAGYISTPDSNGKFDITLINQGTAGLLEVYVVFSKSSNYSPLKDKIYILGYEFTKTSSDLTSSFTIYSEEGLNFYYPSSSTIGNFMAVKLNVDNQLEQGVGVFSSDSSGLGFYVNYNYLWAIHDGSKELIASGVPLAPDYTMVVTKRNNYPRIMFFDSNGNLVFSCDSDIATFPTSGNVGAIGTKNTIYY